MTGRNSALALAALTIALVVCGCGGMSSADGMKQAKSVRSTTARTYWKVRDALPSTLAEPSGLGSFIKCPKTSDALAYTVEDYLQPMRSKPTKQELVASIETSLRPQGWKFTSEGQLPDTDYGAVPAKPNLYGYIAKKDGITVHLTLQEKKGNSPAAGYLNVSSSCRKYGAARKNLLADYASGQQRDHYNQSPGSPTPPVPTGFPTAAT